MRRAEGIGPVLAPQLGGTEPRPGFPQRLGEKRRRGRDCGGQADQGDAEMLESNRKVASGEWLVASAERVVPDDSPINSARNSQLVTRHSQLIQDRFANTSAS